MTTFTMEFVEVLRRLLQLMMASNEEFEALGYNNRRYSSGVSF